MWGGRCAYIETNLYDVLSRVGVDVEENCACGVTCRVGGDLVARVKRAFEQTRCDDVLHCFLCVSHSVLKCFLCVD